MYDNSKHSRYADREIVEPNVALTIGGAIIGGITSLFIWGFAAYIIGGNIHLVCSVGTCIAVYYGGILAGGHPVNLTTFNIIAGIFFVAGFIIGMLITSVSSLDIVGTTELKLYADSYFKGNVVDAYMDLLGYGVKNLLSHFATVFQNFMISLVFYVVSIVFFIRKALRRTRVRKRKVVSQPNSF